jgi:hypothetical protein
VDIGPARDPVDSDRKNRDRHAATTARSMVAGTLRGPSDETGSPPMRGLEGHRNFGELPALARGRTRNNAPGVSRVGPAAAFDRAQARRWVRAPARR